MKKNMDAALRRKEKMENKEARQKKIMMILGFIMAGVVVACLVGWAVFGFSRMMARKEEQKAKLSADEMLELFSDEKALPNKDSLMLGTWYFYQDGDIMSKYLFHANGTMEVYERMGDDFDLTSSTEYRVREAAGKLYVLPEGSSMVVEYAYTIEEDETDEGLYSMSWIYEDKMWRLVKLVKE